jgi:PPOX class probable F420-dependent enzyme
MPRQSQLSPGAVQMLQEKHLAHLATIMEDGTPQLTPVWIDVEPDGSHVLINTVIGRLKAHNTARNSHVAVSVVDGKNWQRVVTVRGVVVEQVPDVGGAHIEKLSIKYRGASFHHESDDRIILRIKPEFVTERNLEKR